MSYSKLRVIVSFIYYSLSMKLFIIMRNQNFLHEMFNYSTG